MFELPFRVRCNKKELELLKLFYTLTPARSQISYNIKKNNDMGEGVCLEPNKKD